MKPVLVVAPVSALLAACQWAGGEEYIDRRSDDVVYAEWCRDHGCFALSECADDPDRQAIPTPPWNKLRSVSDNRRMPLRHYRKSTFFKCGSSEKDTQ